MAEKIQVSKQYEQSNTRKPPLLQTAVPDNTGLLLGIGSVEHPQAACSIYMEPGSELELQISIRRVSGVGYVLTMSEGRSAGKAKIIIEEKTRV